MGVGLKIHEGHRRNVGAIERRTFEPIERTRKTQPHPHRICELQYELTYIVHVLKCPGVYDYEIFQTCNTQLQVRSVRQAQTLSASC